MNQSWVKLYKKMLDWEWYKDLTTFRLFIHCLLKANWKDGEFENLKVPKGSFITSVKKLVEETGLTNQNVRTSLKKLKKSKNLTIKTTNKFTVISINNFDKYQEPNKQLTNNQQTTNKQLTTIEEYKNNRIIDIDERNNNACAREDIFEYNWLEDSEREENE